MNILLLNYEYPPLGGGAANATAHLLREFQAYDDLSIDVVVSSISTARTERPGERVTLHFVDIGKRGNLHHQSHRDLLTYAWRGYRYARSLTKERKYDLCHAFFGIPCGYMARRLGLPYVVSLRGSDVPFYNPRFRRLDWLVFRRISASVWRDAAAVVANSRGLRDLALTTAPDESIEVIPNGVDTDRFRPAPRPGDGLRVLCVSRLIARKGIDYLVRAVALLEGHDASLVLVGEGDQEERLRAAAIEAGITDRVRFAGSVAHDDLPGVYQAADVFVLPSLNEGMSNTVLEAMACGLPIVMTRTGGADELLRHGENGFLIEKRSVDDIAEKLRLYAGDPARVREHGTRSRAIAEAMSWGQSASAYRDLYQRVAGAGKG